MSELDATLACKYCAPADATNGVNFLDFSLIVVVFSLCIQTIAGLLTQFILCVPPSISRLFRIIHWFRCRLSAPGASLTTSEKSSSSSSSSSASAVAFERRTASRSVGALSIRGRVRSAATPSPPLTHTHPHPWIGHSGIDRLPSCTVDSLACRRVDSSSHVSASCRYDAECRLNPVSDQSNGYITRFVGSRRVGPSWSGRIFWSCSWANLIEMPRMRRIIALRSGCILTWGSCCCSGGDCRIVSPVADSASSMHFGVPTAVQRRARKCPIYVAESWRRRVAVLDWRRIICLWYQFN